MNATPMNTTAATTVVSPPRRAPRPAIPRLLPIPFRTFAMPALEIALILLLLASATGIWLAGSHDDDQVRLAAPGTPVATPTAEATPGWTHWRGDATRSGTSNFGPITQPVELWSYDTSADCGPVPAVAGDTVYVACLQSGLYAFARATGEVRWTFTAEPFDAFFNSPTLAGDLAYVVGEDSMSLYAVDIATGEERWRYAAASVAAAPAVTGSMAFVNTFEGFLIGLDAATGEEQWRTTTTTGGRVGDAAVLDGMAYVGSETGDLTAVDAATGEIVWQVDTGDERNGIAVVADGIVYVGAGSPTGSLALTTRRRVRCAGGETSRCSPLPSPTASAIPAATTVLCTPSTRPAARSCGGCRSAPVRIPSPSPARSSTSRARMTKRSTRSTPRPATSSGTSPLMAHPLSRRRWLTAPSMWLRPTA